MAACGSSIYPLKDLPLVPSPFLNLWPSPVKGSKPPPPHLWGCHSPVTGELWVLSFGHTASKLKASCVGWQWTLQHFLSSGDLRGSNLMWRWSFPGMKAVPCFPPPKYFSSPDRSKSPCFCFPQAGEEVLSQLGPVTSSSSTSRPAPVVLLDISGLLHCMGL